MSQHDYVIANASGATVRADINDVLEAVVTNNSGNTEPTDTFPFMWWVDTGGSNPLLKVRNAGDSAWVTVGRLDITNLGIAASFVGSSEPSSPLSGQLWVDTAGANPLLKLRNVANNAWVTLGRADLTNLGLLPLTGGTLSAALAFSNTDHTYLPVGTTAQRSGSPAAGMIRYNSDLSTFEGYNGTAWASVGGGGLVVTSVQTVSGSGSINSSTIDSRQLRFVKGSSGGATASTTPFGSSGGWKDGTEIVLSGTSNADALTIVANDAAKGAVGNFSSIEIGLYTTVTFVYSSTADRWILKGV